MLYEESAPVEFKLYTHTSQLRSEAKPRPNSTPLTPTVSRISANRPRFGFVLFTIILGRIAGTQCVDAVI